MSPDDIFAAQFWPWPDPAIKRDAQGRVLFVNAAFLALYGGRVEDWRGNAVGGWPAPQAPTAHGATPYRFETRLPAADGSEQVYDWVEQTLADGNAFALARNVTVFTQSPPTNPGHVAPAEAPIETVEDHSAAEAPHGEAQPFETPELETASLTAESNEADDLSLDSSSFQAPILNSNEIENSQAPAAEEAQQAPTNANQEAEAIDIPEIKIPEIEIPSDEDYAMTENAGATSVALAPEAATPSAQAAPEAPREFERRALPIEDGDAVLGNNWRDAVIAKAVGADDVAVDAAAASQSAEAPTPNDPPAGATGDAVRILLAEDNAINALLTRTLLEAEGHSVDTVEDGALAVEAMKTASYDLIFMDMRMPNMDGLEATRKIRTLPNGNKLLIIALTANAFDDDRNACFDSGMNDFMTKPVSAEELSEKVRDWTSEDAKARLTKVA